ncbi:MAG: NYN domain-containing protein [Deltaproteobacteria bacterium]|nr:NYN domain-containing protein [Deltaproteobacteria bacterium]
MSEASVYASFEPRREEKLRNWLDNFLDRQPGVRVFTAERHWKQHEVHCRSCDRNNTVCQHCGAPLGRAAEKTVDARIVTDMLNLAWEGAYDLALLVSSDKDFIPAVECLQAKNFRVVNAAWKGLGHELAKVCWASFEIDELIPSLLR